MSHDEFTALLTERFGSLAAVLAEQAAWWGQKIAEIPTASAILESGIYTFRVDELFAAEKFYGGDQWPKEILALREGRRPALVINRLPALVAAAIDRQRREGLPELLDHQRRRLIALITWQNIDAQRLYNYTASAFVEALGLAKPVTESEPAQ